MVVAAVALWPVQPSRDRTAAPLEPERYRDPTPQLMAATTYVTSAPAAAPTRVSSPGQPAAISSEEHPHPITAEREALQQELRLVGALQDALDLEDAQALRALVARYRAHVPGDENALAEGYTRIADCLDAANSGGGVVAANAARVAAAAYYENERASTLRRYVRRVCLER